MWKMGTWDARRGRVWEKSGRQWAALSVKDKPNSAEQAEKTEVPASLVHSWVRF